MPEAGLARVEPFEKLRDGSSWNSIEKRKKIESHPIPSSSLQIFFLNISCDRFFSSLFFFSFSLSKTKQSNSFYNIRTKISGRKRYLDWCSLPTLKPERYHENERFNPRFPVLPILTLSFYFRFFFLLPFFETRVRVSISAKFPPRHAKFPLYRIYSPVHLIKIINVNNVN